MTKTARNHNRIYTIYTFVFVIVAITAIIAADITVSAASTVPDQYRSIFNAEFYAAKYPDLAAAFGSNEAALFNHFLTAGMAEGRQGSAEFDVNFYRAAYPDLQAVFGDNLPAYYNHYMTCGKAEGRVGAGAATPTATAQTSTTVANTQVPNGGARVYQVNYRTWKTGEQEFYTNILDSILTSGMSDMEVARAIHDYLCRTYHGAKDGETIVTLNDIYTERVWKPANGYGNRVNQERANSTAFDCSGYAQAYRTLMNIAGIQTESVCGRAENGVGHVWNRTMVNGQWLYTDVGWDDSLSTTRYFMISESQMNQDHLPERNGQYRCY